MKRDKIDTVFSLFVRTRDRFTCQRCGKRRDGGTRIECSHIMSRRYFKTRWDPDNALALCHSCHRWWHENPVEAFAWIETRIGQDALMRLRWKAKDSGKLLEFEREIIYRDLKERLDALELGG